MLEGLRGAISLDQLRTPGSARKRLNWSPMFQCPSLFVRSSVFSVENFKVLQFPHFWFNLDEIQDIVGLPLVLSIPWIPRLCEGHNPYIILYGGLVHMHCNCQEDPVQAVMHNTILPNTFQQLYWTSIFSFKFSFLNFGTVFLAAVRMRKLRKAHCSPPLVGENNSMVFTSHTVPFPATRDLRSLMAGNGTSWETKTISFSSNQWR